MSMRKRHLTVPKNTDTFEGVRCKLGHDGTRYVATGQCVTCIEIYPTSRYATDLKRYAADGIMPTIHGRVLLAAQGGRCAHCGTDKKLESDHKKSIDFGGNNWPLNRQWLCQTCNRKKWCHEDAEYRRNNGIPARTRWDAAPHIVRLLDQDARLIGDSFLKTRCNTWKDGRAALEALLRYSQRKGTPLSKRPRKPAVSVDRAGNAPAIDLRLVYELFT